MAANRKQLNDVVHVHLKKLVKDLDNALARERGGGSSMSSDEYVKLHGRAKRYYQDDVVVSTEDFEEHE